MAPPLTFRLQNLPGRWLARAEEQDIVAALAASTVVTVVGAPGSGRRTAARAALHARFRKSLNLGIELIDGDDVPRQLAAALGLADVSTPSLEQLVDTADASGNFLLLAPRSFSADTYTLLATFQRYARTTRIVVISEHVLPPTVGPAVQIGNLTAIERAKLIALHRLPATVPEAVVAALGGLHLASLGAVLEAAHQGELHQLASCALVQALAVTSIAVELSVLDQIVDDIAATYARCSALGIIQPSARGLHLEPAFRDWVRAAWRHGPPIALAKALSMQLAAAPELGYRYEAVAIALDAREYQRAFDWLGDLPPPHLNSALAGKLARAQSPIFDKWRLRCATEAGAFDVVRSTHRPSEIDELLTWAEGQARAGNIDTAITAANEVAAAASTSHSDEARMLVARLRSTHGSPQDALSVLDEITDGNLRLRADALAARCWLQLGQASAAVVIAKRVAQLLPGVTADPQLQAETWIQLGALYHDLGELSLATEMLAYASAAYDGSSYVTSRVALLRHAIATDRGERVALAIALPANPTLHETFDALLSAQRALADGKPDVASALATAVVQRNRGYVGAWARTLQIRAALQDAALPIADAFVSATHWDHIADAYWARWCMQHNQPYQLVPGNADIAESVFAGAAAAWEHAIVTNTGDAVRLAEQAYVYCQTKGLALLAAEAAVGWCQALIAADAPMAAGVQALRAVADAIGAPFFAAISDLFVAWQQRDYVRLEALRAMVGTIGKHASFLLSETQPGPLDLAIFRRPLTTIKTRGSDATRWLGVDGETKQAWLDSGVVVTLHDKLVLWKLLAAIACSDSGATKEFLVETVWGNSYHPLRHDKRLQNAVHKLRHLFGETEDQRWLETCADGYIVAPGVTVRLARMPTI
jgi:tetratricopeptide (TPR) repeat protein